MKSIIYPYNLNVSQIMRNENIIKELNIQACVTPRGYLLEGKDISCIDEGTITGFKVTNDFNGAIELADTVIWADYSYYLGLNHQNSFKNIILNNIEFAINKKKDIICLELLSENEFNYFSKLATKKKVKFIYYNNSTVITPSIDIKDSIYIPIIGILGLNDNCMKFNTQLIVREALQNNGYKVSQIGSKHYSDLFGFHSFPPYIFDNKINNFEKIYAFKEFIIKIIKDENPDILVIGVPKGILNTSETVIDNFGLISYLITCSVKFDYSILNIPCFTINNSFINEMELLLKYKYGISLDALFLSNIAVDEIDDGKMNYNAYKVLSKQVAEKTFKENSNLCKPVFDSNCKEEIISSIESTLTNSIYAI